jgi:predicted metalloprotease with PDZ domain
VRTNQLDHTHGYFNGAATFFFIPDYQHQPISVTIVPPTDWVIATPLPPAPDTKNTFIAPNFDILVDSPFEIGQHTVHPFEVLGKPHEYVIQAGNHNLDVDALIIDTQKMIAAEAAMFGGLPYDRYQFILHLPTSGYGGLEHRDGCCLIFSRRSTRIFCNLSRTNFSICGTSNGFGPRRWRYLITKRKTIRRRCGLARGRQVITTF